MLPVSNMIIWDEAHEAAQIFRNFNTDSLSEYWVFRLSSTLHKILDTAYGFSYALKYGGPMFSKNDKNIEEKYMDCNLSIATIAEDMERNSQYISKVFRAETGDGITDYISRMRVYKAQEILLSKKISIEEVGSIVGFASVRTFRRCFTKYIGCTPSAYIEKNTGIIGENR